MSHPSGAGTLPDTVPPPAARLPWLRAPGVGSIRERLVLVIVVLVAIGIGLSGTVAYVLEWGRIQKNAFDQLTIDAEEFRTLASGTNPETSRPYGSVRSVLQAGMQQRIMSESGGMVGILDGKLTYVMPDSYQVRPEAHPDFVSRTIEQSRRTQVTFDRMVGDGFDYAYLVAPVHKVDPVENGALVRVVDLQIERRRLNDTFVTYAMVAVGAILIIGAVTWLVTARVLEPISWVQRTAEEITEHDLSRRIPVRGRDDLAALASTVNTMLDRLESAVGAQKRLLDDVGHELRTPMTIIRGHLELMDTTDPMDAEVVRSLALEELSRMSNLVNDLILLAQSERSDFVVLSEVDMARLTDETYEKVRVLGNRPWLMDDLADATVHVDPQRLTQAWLQLAANAVKYSPDGSPIGMGSRLEGDHVRIWIRDKGMGFTEDEKELVLERFGRSRRAGAKRTDSAGLGLAIVNSIALAHGGRVEIDSVPDEGSTVSLVIPRHPVLEQTP